MGSSDTLETGELRVGDGLSSERPKKGVVRSLVARDTVGVE